MAGGVRYAGPARFDAAVAAGASTVELVDWSGEDLRTVVAAAHDRGLGVVLATPSGVDDAVRWLTAAAADGLRLGPLTEVRSAADAVTALAAHLGRPLSLVVGSAFVVPSSGGTLATLDDVAGWLWDTTDGKAAALSPGLRAVAATLLLTAPVTPVLRPDEDDLAPLCRRLADLRASLGVVGTLAAGPTPPRAGALAVAVRRGSTVIAANLSETPQRVNLHGVPRSVLFATAEGLTLTHDSADLPPESAAAIACCRLD